MTQTYRVFTVLLVGLISGAVLNHSVQASPVSISNAFLMLDNVSANPEGVLVGEDIFFGANQVIPNGTGGTTGLATVANTSFSKVINYLGNADLPNMFSRETPDNPNLRSNIWSLVFSNPDYTSTTVQRSILPTLQQAPMVNSITVSGTGQNPVISWTPPAGASVSGYRVNIYDSSQLNAIGHPTQIFTQNIDSSTTSFTVPNTGNQSASDIALTSGTQYYFEIQLLQTKDGLTTNLQNNNIAARSRVFATFQELPASAPPTVYLPVTLAKGSYQFNMAVVPGQTYYIDPSVATGYVYKTGAGDPNFASVTLPTLQAAQYDLSYMLNGSLFNVMLSGGVQYMFLEPGGVDTFTVTGIDPVLALDPSNPTAFITGLTFVSEGSFTGTQTAISETPLPTAFPLFATGLGAMAMFGRRRKRKAPSLAA